MSYELLETAEDVRRYLSDAGLAPLVGDPAEADVREVTAGNMNRVFIARGGTGSVAVKQAPPFVQVAGPGWPIDPSRLRAEARAYERLAELTPDIVPAVHSVDLERYVLVMEDLSALTVLRDLLVAQLASVVRGDAPLALDMSAVAADAGRFVGALSRATSAAALGAEQHARLREESANPDLCALTLDVVLDEPFREHDHNSWRPVLDERVAALYRDAELRAAVADLRQIFSSRAEALLHGDLHSGSIMAATHPGGTTTVVFDPEFSFVGPIGMDLGLLWANLAIAAEAARAVGADDLAQEREAAIDASASAFLAEWSGAPLDPASVWRDAWRFAGAEAIRRVAGYSHAADLESLPSGASDAATVRVFDRARAWLVDAQDPSHPIPRLEQ